MRAKLLATSMITGFGLLGAATASAQAVPDHTAPASAANAGTSVQELVVTGSRIPQANLTSVSPITAVNNAAIKLQGATDTVDIINQLPQNGTSLGNSNDPLSSTGGYTTVNLRNLGAVRTLVLIDGKRLMPGDPTLGGEAADLDTIPTQLVDRVEVVTGGASAVYGSDAIAGVVNFILRKNFEGVQVDAQYGFYTHYNGQDDTTRAVAKNLIDYGPAAAPGEFVAGENYNVSLMMGANSPDDKGNVTAYLTYHHQDPVTQGRYDYSGCLAAVSGAALRCSGSSNSNKFTDGVTGLPYSVSGVAPNNQFIPFASTNATTPPPAFNSSPYEYLARQDERYQAGFIGRYEFSKAAEAYADFSFMDDRSVIHIAPGALFGNNLNVNCDNPFLSAQQVATICTANGLGPNDLAGLTFQRRDIEGGPRVQSYQHTSYRAVVGLRGDLGSAFHYDVFGQFGYTSYFTRTTGYISVSKAQNALLVTGTAANPTCITGAPCVPYDIFADGGVTQAAVNYVSASGSVVGDTQEQVVGANITGDLSQYGLKSPFASSGLGVNIGTEYRREALSFTPDDESQSGDLSGSSGASPIVNGAFDVKELFGEARLPLVQDAPFIKDLSIEGGYRFSHYSSSGDVDAYKIAGDWSPTEDIRFRASYQRAVRAPNVNELFQPELATQTSVVNIDPCAPGTPDNPNAAATATLAQCMHTGVTAAQYGNGQSPQVPGGTDKVQQCPAFQCGTALGGNLALKPEESDTYSVGGVFTPRFIPGFSLSVDYFSIDIRNEISTVPINITFNNCLNNNLNCNLVVRQPNGSLWNTGTVAGGGFIVGTNVNIGFTKTTGFDFAASYRLGLDRFGLQNMGGLVFDYQGTYTRSFVQEPVPGQGTYDCAGLYGPTCGFQPQYRHKLRVSYNTPWNLGVSAAWRFTGPMGLDSNTSQPLLTSGKQDVYEGHVGSISYFDLTATYKIRSGLAIRVGANNIFDKDPPILTAAVNKSSGNPNTFSNNYDVLGRQIFMGFTADF